MIPNIRPYLELIGFGALAEYMPPQDFVTASVLLDAFEQMVDQVETTEVDSWWEQYGNARHYSRLIEGIEHAQALKTLPQEAIALTNFLLILLPTIKKKYAT